MSKNNTKKNEEVKVEVEGKVENTLSKAEMVRLVIKDNPNIADSNKEISAKIKEVFKEEIPATYVSTIKSQDKAKLERKEHPTKEAFVPPTVHDIVYLVEAVQKYSPDAILRISEIASKCGFDAVKTAVSQLTEGK